MAKRAVFFDFGGTLLVMRRDRIISKILREAGYPVTPRDVRGAYFRAEPRWLLTYGNRKSTPEEAAESYRVLDTMVFSLLHPDKEKAEADRVSLLMRGMWSSIQRTIPLELYPDAAPTLRRLGDDGYKLALVSNAPPDTLETVDALGLTELIPVIVVSGLVGVSKPNPEIFRIALRRSGVEPGEAVHVGDLYEADVRGARNAGVDGILLDRDGAYGETDCPKISGLGGVHDYLE